MQLYAKLHRLNCHLFSHRGVCVQTCHLDLSCIALMQFTDVLFLRAWTTAEYT